MTENNLPRSEMTLDEAIKHAEEKSGCNNACAMEHRQLAQWLKELKILRENILPRPVIRNDNGKLLKDYTPQDFYLIFEGIEQHFWFKSILADEGYSAGANCQRNFFAEEIASIITVLISFLNAIGYDEKGRSELFAKVNETNEKCGILQGG